MRFLIINSDTGSITEEHNVKHLADKAISVLNTHEVKNDRVPIYYVQPTCVVCDSEDMTEDNFDPKVWKCTHCGNYTEMK